jgi:enoyl-CoA hydratase
MAILEVAPRAGDARPPALELENLLYAKRGGIAYVTVNRPQVLNALNRAT